MGWGWGVGVGCGGLGYKGVVGEVLARLKRENGRGIGYQVRDAAISLGVGVHRVTQGQYIGV